MRAFSGLSEFLRLAGTQKVVICAHGTGIILQCSMLQLKLHKIHSRIKTRNKRYRRVELHFATLLPSDLAPRSKVTEYASATYPERHELVPTDTTHPPNSNDSQWLVIYGGCRPDT